MVIGINEPSEIRAVRCLMRMGKEPTPSFLRAVGSEFGVPLHAARSALENTLPHVDIPEPPQCRIPATQRVVHTNYDGPYKGTHVHSFGLGPWLCRVENWRQMIQYICEILWIEHQADFREAVSRITGQRREYFSDRPAALSRDPRSIGTSGLFVETNLAANNAVSLASALAEIFGYGAVHVHSTL